MQCFKCGLDSGIARRSAAMHPSWYEVDFEMAQRIVFLCEWCYEPDSLAGKRRTTGWEDNEAVWGVGSYDDDEGWVAQNAWDNGIRALEGD